MATCGPPAVNPDENASLENSTAPTTPEGSLSFSPVLRPLEVDDELARETPKPISVAGTAAGLNGLATAAVRHICCVGAGYVGKFVVTLGASFSTSASSRG
jgi:UDPglucose 6-dehydrogenase